MMRRARTTTIFGRRWARGTDTVPGSLGRSIYLPHWPGPLASLSAVDRVEATRADQSLRRCRRGIRTSRGSNRVAGGSVEAPRLRCRRVVRGDRRKVVAGYASFPRVNPRRARSDAHAFLLGYGVLPWPHRGQGPRSRIGSGNPLSHGGPPDGAVRLRRKCGSLYDGRSNFQPT